jgi:hypothetical protein
MSSSLCRTCLTPLPAPRSHSPPPSGILLPHHVSYSPSSHPHAASNVTENIQNLVNNSGAAGTRTPILDEAGRVPRRGNNKRKQTLLSLLDALSELTGDDDLNGETCASYLYPPPAEIPRGRGRLDEAVLIFGLFLAMQPDKDGARHSNGTLRTITTFVSL